MAIEEFQASLQKLQSLPEELSINPSISNQTIIGIVQQFANQLQTNCISAAEALFSGIAPICAVRPEIAKDLLNDALLPLYYMGYTQEKEVQQFAQYLLQCQTVYAIPLREEGRKWLTNSFPHHKEIVQHILDQRSKAEDS